MKYNKAVVTVTGSSFLSTAFANKKAPILDKMTILNTDVPANKTLESLTIQDFSAGKQYDINNVSQTDNSFTATSVVTNDGLNADYPAKLIGLTGYVDGSDRQLISVSQAVDPFIIEKQTDTSIKLLPSISVGFNNTTDISITVKSEVYITKNDLDKMLSSMGYATVQYVNSKIAGIDLSSAIKESKDYTDQKISDVNTKINNIDLSSAVTQANNYTDTKFNNIDLSKPETSANAYTDNKINALNINQYAKNTDLNSNVNNINSQINNVKNQVNNNTNDINTNRNNINNKANYWDLNNSVNQLNANISQAEANAKAYADSKYRFFDNDNDAIEAGKYLPAGTLIIVRG